MNIPCNITAHSLWAFPGSWIHILKRKEIHPKKNSHMLFSLSWTVHSLDTFPWKARSGLNIEECQDSYLDVITFALELLKLVLGL